MNVKEHIHFLRGFLEALSRVTIRAGYKHMFWVDGIDLPTEDKIETIKEGFGLDFEELQRVDNYIGEIEDTFNSTISKYFLGGEYNKKSNHTLDVIGNLAWHAVEYVEWLNAFSSTCIVEKAVVSQKDVDEGTLWVFTIDNNYLVILVIIQMLIDEET